MTQGQFSFVDRVIEAVIQTYTPKGVALRTAVLLKQVWANDEQVKKLCSHVFGRGSDRRIINVSRVARVGTVIIDESTAAGHTRAGDRAGFTDLRDALVGKSLGRDKGRQRGVLAKYGINGVSPEMIEFINSEESGA